MKYSCIICFLTSHKMENEGWLLKKWLNQKRYFSEILICDCTWWKKWVVCARFAMLKTHKECIFLWWWQETIGEKPICHQDLWHIHRENGQNYQPHIVSKLLFSNLTLQNVLTFFHWLCGPVIRLFIFQSKGVFFPSTLGRLSLNIAVLKKMK